jgi:NADH-quinone oxidoreductase subunit C|tara:strand:+ start:951 stop:1628 length:678 start_codon:yes stop_codon:yes gene_type:complete
MTDTTSLAEKLTAHFKDTISGCETDRDQITLVVSPSHLLSTCEALRDEDDFSFSQLVDLCGVDYSTYGQVDWATEETTATGFSRGRNKTSVSINNEERFAVVYHLLSIKHNHRLRLRCYLPEENPTLASVTEVWSSANWYEREAYDMFGILFEGHPDLRRLLTDYGFIGHPFRKDFPLEGNVEVRYDPDQERVVYQPVTITNRVLVPRVIRDDHRYIPDEEPSDA